MGDSDDRIDVIIYKVSFQKILLEEIKIGFVF